MQAYNYIFFLLKTDVHTQILNQSNCTVVAVTAHSNVTGPWVALTASQGSLSVPELKIRKDSVIQICVGTSVFRIKTCT